MTTDPWIPPVDRAALVRAAEDAGVRVLRPHVATSPTSAAMLHFRPGDGTASDVTALVDALRPRVVLAPTGDVDELHLVGDGGTWVTVVLAATDEAGEPEAADELPWEVRQAVLAAAAVVGATVPFGVHDQPDDVVERLLREQLTRTDPPLASCPALGAWEYLLAVETSAQDAHLAHLQARAAAYAVEIRDAERVEPGLTKPVLRNIARAYIRRLDPRCGTKDAVEPVAQALWTLTRA